MADLKRNNSKFEEGVLERLRGEGFILRFQANGSMSISRQNDFGKKKARRMKYDKDLGKNVPIE